MLFINHVVLMVGSREFLCMDKRNDAFDYEAMIM